MEILNLPAGMESVSQTVSLSISKRFLSKFYVSIPGKFSRVLGQWRKSCIPTSSGYSGSSDMCPYTSSAAGQDGSRHISNILYLNNETFVQLEYEGGPEEGTITRPRKHSVDQRADRKHSAAQFRYCQKYSN